MLTGQFFQLPAYRFPAVPATLSPQVRADGPFKGRFGLRQPASALASGKHMAQRAHGSPAHRQIANKIRNRQIQDAHK